jgi:ribonucleoside-diphosphate reductase alpha chain
MEMTTYQRIIHSTRYARYLPELKRRESWDETVDRLIDYLGTKVPTLKSELVELREAVYNLEVMPSMRLMMTAGEACERDNISAYNCSYLAVNNKRSFSEALYILMNGTGVGFSCERQDINKLPAVPEEVTPCDDVIMVEDSKLGWAKAYKKLLSSLWEGDIPTFDFSKVRPAGARLKTFGGRASGPDPLKRLFTFSVETFQSAQGRKLNSLEVHDLMCMIGEIVVVGGVRRSALISLSNLTDRRMREAKTGAWWELNKQRALANNSVAYTEKPDSETFIEEWLALVKSKSGERGIFNRVASQKQAAKWGRRAGDLSYGTNPCSEIILRDKQFCNLTECVVRADDTEKSLLKKIRLASILGTIQSTLTNFKFLSAEWVANTSEERLLGVSLTGIMDAKITSNPDPKFLERLRDEARVTNEKYAELLGIESSTSITCVKPSGTVSQLVDSASGIHARHNDYYVRTIRIDKKDPVYEFLKSQGIKVEDEVNNPSETAVFSFPMKAPKGAITRNDKTAMEQLENWLVYQRHFCEHKPSVTISVKDDEWLDVGAWVWKYFDELSGISFLPHSDHSYQQAPYTDCTKEEYKALTKETPETIAWDEFIEVMDNTTSAQTLACTGGQCEI